MVVSVPQCCSNSRALIAFGFSQSEITIVKEKLHFFFSPKDPLRCNSPVAMETSIETMDPLGVNAPIQPEGEMSSNACPY